MEGGEYYETCTLLRRCSDGASAHLTKRLLLFADGRYRIDTTVNGVLIPARVGFNAWHFLDIVQAAFPDDGLEQTG